MAQIPNKNKVSITIAGTGMVQDVPIPDSGMYTKFAISIPAANVDAVGVLQGDLGNGFLDIVNVDTTGDDAVVSVGLRAGAVSMVTLAAPCAGGVQLGGINVSNNQTVVVNVMMTGSLYSSGRNS